VREISPFLALWAVLGLIRSTLSHYLPPEMNISLSITQWTKCEDGWAFELIYQQIHRFEGRSCSWRFARGRYGTTSKNAPTLEGMTTRLDL
jgi:hypothetical protein